MATIHPHTNAMLANINLMRELAEGMDSDSVIVFVSLLDSHQEMIIQYDRMVIPLEHQMYIMATINLMSMAHRGEVKITPSLRSRIGNGITLARNVLYCPDQNKTERLSFKARA